MQHGNVSIPTRTLGNSGIQLPIIGFGAATLGGAYGAVDIDAAQSAIAAAVAAGMTYFDTSPFYGKTRSETILGKCLRTISRNKYIIATKVGRYDITSFDFSAQRVRESVDESLMRLGCDYIDLIQCHDIEFVRLEQVIEEAIPALQALKQAGKVRAIGITGYPIKIFHQILAHTHVDAILSYCRQTLLDQSLSNEIPWLSAQGIGIINGSPLSMGLLSSKGPPAWHPAPPAMREACRQAVTICQSAGVELGDLALQVALQTPGIASTLVGISSSVEVERNLALLAKPIDETLLKAVKAVLKPHEDVAWQSGLMENN